MKLTFHSRYSTVWFAVPHLRDRHVFPSNLRCVCVSPAGASKPNMMILGSSQLFLPVCSCEPESHSHTPSPIQKGGRVLYRCKHIRRYPVPSIYLICPDASPRILFPRQSPYSVVSRRPACKGSSVIPPHPSPFAKCELRTE
jgi:hypothetical protein